jgi:N6-adenosine-specific RNA methylase IME4
MFVSNTSALTGVQAGDDFSQPETAVLLFDPLLAHSYDLIVIDPPWPFATWSAAGQDKSASKHYRIMTLADIKALPVRKLLKDHAVVLLWTASAAQASRSGGLSSTRPSLPGARSRQRQSALGCGYWARPMSRPAGTVGKPIPLLSFDGIARHSRNPDEFYRDHGPHAGPAACRPVRA